MDGYRRGISKSLSFHGPHLFTFQCRIMGTVLPYATATQPISETTSRDPSDFLGCTCGLAGLIYRGNTPGAYEARWYGPRTALCHAVPCLVHPACYSMRREGIQSAVVAVLDGDICTVLHDSHEEDIRLNAIDCPEKNQPYGKDAKKVTASRMLNKIATVQGKNVDRDGRAVGDVLLADGTNLNRELVKQGSAWWFFRYSQHETIKRLEVEARDGKRGLWGDPIPIPPWVFPNL